MRAIDRKLLRDAGSLRGQLIAIGLVLASGVGLFLGMRTTMVTLETAAATYYARERFADVQAPLTRAPEHLAARLAAIPGVARVATRVRAEVLLDVPGMSEAATGRLCSLPAAGRPGIDDLRLRSGRLPDPQRGEEVVAHEAFAEAHGLGPGDRLHALIDGVRTELRIVGTALSPEFTYALGPGQILPDDRRFGILWMGREALGEAFDMDGAFNEVGLQLGRGANLDAVRAEVDRILEPYGGVGAIAREDLPSAAFVRNELDQLRTFGSMVPGMFLLVAAFLLHVVVGRIVRGQREQIAALKALGYRDREIGLHYAKLVGLLVLAGLAAGLALAGWLGSAMCRLYQQYYRFPELPFAMPAREVLLACALTAAAAGLGTLSAIRGTVRLAPAEAMRQKAPPAYRATVLERLGLARLVPPSGRIVLRELERRPGRALLAVGGIAMAVALVVVSTFAYGSILRAINLQFGLQQREDVALTLSRPRALAALHDLRHLPGVLDAEPFRSVPVRLRHGPRHDDLALVGMPRGGRLQAVLDEDLGEVTPRGPGLVLPRKLAEKLGVEVGATLRVEFRSGARPVHALEVVQIAETWLGLAAYVELDALCRLLGETPTMDGAHLLVDELELQALHEAVKATPQIAGIAERRHTFETFARLVDENLGTSLSINLAFALVMALGVLYNTARISLAERARDLASLRVLGFRRREVAAILLGELALVTLVALPFGLGLGRLGAAAAMRSLDTEQLRLPFVIAPWTEALAVLTVVGAALIAGFQAWRRLERIDIVEVLKTRD
jgi:putative ABC transport system permease protein